jgi:riboflavin kinase / FMN adenylyltransferase
MEVTFGPEHSVPDANGSAVTIGAYDGVHVGHRHLIGRLRQLAAERGLRSVVVTFDRHPAFVVRPQSAPSLLTDLDQKLELLASTGVDETVVVKFDELRANESAEDFVLEVLVRALRARLVVVGEDFHFGHGRKGNVALLSEMGAQHGFEVVGLGLEADATGGVVSSTRVRHALAQGDVRTAAKLLGRHHEVRGIVVHGSGRGGSQLGFPTANVDVPTEIALPSPGIYACWYGRPGGSVHPAAVSLGYRPTFSEHEPVVAVGDRTLETFGTGEHEPVRAALSPDPPRADGEEAPVLEAFLLDFEGDLYAQPARVSFVGRIRPERRFDSVAQLVAAIEEDVVRVREQLELDLRPPVPEPRMAE